MKKLVAIVAAFILVCGSSFYAFAQENNSQVIKSDICEQVRDTVKQEVPAKADTTTVPTEKTDSVAQPKK